jgi:hypothetical protein
VKVPTRTSPDMDRHSSGCPIEQPSPALLLGLWLNFRLNLCLNGQAQLLVDFVRR